MYLLSLYGAADAFTSSAKEPEWTHLKAEYVWSVSGQLLEDINECNSMSSDKISLKSSWVCIWMIQMWIFFLLSDVGSHQGSSAADVTYWSWWACWTWAFSSLSCSHTNWTQTQACGAYQAPAALRRPNGLGREVGSALLLALDILRKVWGSPPFHSLLYSFF